MRDPSKATPGYVGVEYIKWPFINALSEPVLMS
jgi:hypothetical protein